LVVVLALGVVAFSLKVLPSWVIPSSAVRHPNGSELNARIERQNEVRGIAIQALAGLVLALGALYTARTYSLKREGQLTDRLKAAVDQVHKGGVAAVGGVLALERLAKDSDRDRPTILELLATYIRMEAQLPSSFSAADDERPVLASTLQTAITAIGRRSREVDRRPTIDLSWCALRGADLREAIIANALFANSDLTMARLNQIAAPGVDFAAAKLTNIDATEAQIRGANLAGAVLTKAFLTKVDLRDSDLRGTELSGAFLSEAQLDGCDLTAAQGDETMLPLAHLDGAFLMRSRLPRGYFVRAKLRKARLNRAVLDGAVFQLADLREADLSEAILHNADLRGSDCRLATFRDADLRGALLEGANLAGADIRGVRRNPEDSVLPPTEAHDDGHQLKAQASEDGSPTLNIVGLPRAVPNEAYAATLRRWQHARHESK
jgi:uncharacterized protein YjbI with pentapeptide repeats